MRIRGLWRLRKAARQVENRWIDLAEEPRSLILMYHRVAPIADSVCGTIVTTANFRAHLQVITELGVPLSLQQCLDGLAGGRVQDSGIVLTFDDGYADSSTVVAPLLATMGLSATMYVPGSGSSADPIFWWDEAAALCFGSLTLPPVIQLNVDGRSQQFSEAWGERVDVAADRWRVGDPAPPTARHRLFRSLYRILVRLEPGAQRELLAELRRQCGEACPLPASSRLSPEQIRSLCEAGHTIGAHTFSHAPLDDQRSDAVRWEIQKNRVALESITGEPVTTFAYPYGLFGRGTVREVRRSGFASACSSDEGAVWRHSAPLRLPRLTIPDEDGDAFRARLLRYLRPRRSSRNRSSMPDAPASGAEKVLSRGLPGAPEQHAARTGGRV